ncbi:lipoyl synthase [Candidatus Woesearchaeota archaeon]|nr:lipoyl synthase [Candidatus Woesearchaeota archaeon]
MESKLIQIRQEPLSKPDWIRVKLPTQTQYFELKNLLRKSNLHTVCEEAACPNIYECFSRNVATFMIMGDICTRYCHYCHVKTGKPTALDSAEPEHLASAIFSLGLQYVVITCVTRDDLPDGGACHFVSCIDAIRAKVPSCAIEVLTSDFSYNDAALACVAAAAPDVFSHNIEAPRRIYRQVRKKGKYEESLRLLHLIKELNPSLKTKSGFMLGLGETDDEIFEVMADLRMIGCDFLTIGQYLQPTLKHAAVSKFYHPTEFEKFVSFGKELGFLHVEAGPLVRSSYRADKLNSHL